MHQSQVSFVDALDEEHARRVFRQKMEREQGIIRVSIEAVTVAAKPQNWISLRGIDGEPYFVGVDTEMDDTDVTGPFGSYGEAQAVAEALKYDAQVLRLVPAEPPTGEDSKKQAKRWGSFRDSNPRAEVVAKMHALLAETGSEIEVVGALVAALEDYAKSIPDGPAEFVNELVRRIMNATP